MKSMLFVIPTLSGGGAEKVLVNLANELSDKYLVTTLTLFDTGVNKCSLSKRVKYRHIFKWNFRGNIYLFKMFNPAFLSKVFIRGDYDYIVAFLEYTVTRIVSGYRGKAKKIAWIHSTVNPQTLKTFLSPYRSKKECIECYNKFDKIVCVSEDVAKSFKSEFTEVKTPCLVKYNILNSKKIAQLSLEPITDDIQFSSQRINFCSVGRLIPIKGFMRLLQVYKRLINEGIALNTHLYILGIGPDKTSLENYISTNGINSYVTLLGYQANPYKYVSKMDLFVCSSYSEGLSTAVTEAILLGIPVLTTQCSGMNELLDDGNCGCIVENSESGLYSGLKKLIANEHLRLHYKERVLVQRTLFDDSRILKEIEDLF